MGSSLPRPDDEVSGLRAWPGALPPEAAADDAARFLLDVVRALHAYGMPAHRLEAMADALAAQLQTEAYFFCTPTALLVALGTPPEQRTFLVRADSGELDLGKLRDLDAIANAVARGDQTPAEGSAAVASVLRQPGPPAALTLFAHAAVAAAAAVLLGGRLPEALTASCAGFTVGLLELLARRSQPLGRLLLPASALAAAALSGLGTALWPDLARPIATVAGLIILVPGLALTIAMNEIATGHLVSGTSRLSRAFMAFLLLGFGAALGSELVALLPFVTDGGAADRLGPLYTWAAFATCLAPLAVLLRARLRDAPFFVPAALLAFGAVQQGSQLVDPALAAGAGALLLGVVGNGYARWRDRPAAIVIVPGLLLLVPGSLGFRSITHFLDEDVLTAVGTAFDVALLAVALVGGLLVATLALPPRKAL
ncbi:MAG TPA: threonine/serine exporter family protein [Polyangiaceae bacterium LLY-WYZ-15_(1-7)]|nr:threonine/serine exporter family protein [Polyangiaceae bacterium LLY-WYZ-15_(1-7)]HJL09427.1 threonine/serine exporter family protein [Polyangiaceae bacterium LLY-WYZ-15_(1-7)]HJL23595.1 threonine/serine exporter family protein [Polyangiaceae bacterium LLY-WYZ-15_(1-7)]HJL45467.1 threonine/serine exporter family protein [Polyangiaceae bacterium LLY-WYZ-15_(1-7)]